MGLGQPSLQSLVRWAEYQVEVAAGRRSAPEVQAAMARLLAADTIPWKHARERQIRHYDLRPLVLSLALESLEDDLCRLVMRLKADQEGSGRCEQVTAALGFEEPPRRIHRCQLYVEETSPAARSHRLAEGAY